MSTFKNATVVVIHGAWADGSSWELVIRRLLNEGLNVVAAPIPLTSLSDDAAALRRTITTPVKRAQLRSVTTNAEGCTNL